MKFKGVDISKQEEIAITSVIIKLANDKANVTEDDILHRLIQNIEENGELKRQVRELKKEVKRLKSQKD